jgi:hypothetical protein
VAVIELLPIGKVVTVRDATPELFKVAEPNVAFPF